MKRNLIAVILAVALGLAVASYANAQVPPFYAGDECGSNNYYPDEFRHILHWTAFSCPGWVSDSDGGIAWGYTLSTIAQGALLSNKPQPWEMFSPN